MKTKKFLMLLAAVLLSSVSAFAQSGNNEPLKGDVNEDGVVDVADIAALIAIIKNNAQVQTTYYWYVGTNEYNLTNYTSLTKVSSIPSSGSITANRQYVYFVMPANKQLASLYDVIFNYEYDLIESNNEVNIYQTVGKITGTINYTIN